MPASSSAPVLEAESLLPGGACSELRQASDEKVGVDGLSPIESPTNGEDSGGVFISSAALACLYFFSVNNTRYVLVCIGRDVDTLKQVAITGVAIAFAAGTGAFLCGRLYDAVGSHKRAVMFVQFLAMLTACCAVGYCLELSFTSWQVQLCLVLSLFTSMGICPVRDAIASTQSLEMESRGLGKYSFGHKRMFLALGQASIAVLSAHCIAYNDVSALVVKASFMCICLVVYGLFFPEKTVTYLLQTWRASESDPYFQQHRLVEESNGVAKDLTVLFGACLLMGMANGFVECLFFPVLDQLGVDSPLLGWAHCLALFLECPLFYYEEQVIAALGGYEKAFMAAGIATVFRLSIISVVLTLEPSFLMSGMVVMSESLHGVSRVPATLAAARLATEVAPLGQVTTWHAILTMAIGSFGRCASLISFVCVMNDVESFVYVSIGEALLSSFMMFQFWRLRHPISGRDLGIKFDIEARVQELGHDDGQNYFPTIDLKRKPLVSKDTQLDVLKARPKLRVALVHYTFAPVVGGVEKVMSEHAALIARHGFAVRVVAGEGGSLDGVVEFVRIPELHSRCPQNISAQADLEQGAGMDKFNTLAATLERKLWSALHDCDVVILHNIMTMHFNLAATHAFLRIAAKERAPRFISWVHDIAVENPKYPVRERRSVQPWSAMAQMHEDFEYVVISPQRQEELCSSFGVAADSCQVVENGIHPFRCQQPPKRVEDFMIRAGAHKADIVLFNCARLLPRKNIEYVINVTQELCSAGGNAILILTGAHDPHNETSKQYREKLKAMVANNGMRDRVHFVSDSFECSDADVAALYQLTDVYFHCSRDEGFGLPLLEAAMFRSKIFWPSSNPQLLRNGVHVYDLEEEPKTVAQTVAWEVQQCPTTCARREVKKRYAWDFLFERKLLPLIFLHADT